jgi:hypothetical protein
MARSWRRFAASTAFLVAAALTVTGLGAAGAVAATDPPFIDPAADWLTTVNYFRAMAGVGPVTENPVWSAGAVNHSCYMLYNGITHEEVSGKPGYTPEGDAAGRNGNVAVSSLVNETSRKHIELWMTGPFHAIGVIRPNLTQVGFGKCDKADTSPWRSGATLDVLHGLGPAVAQTQPILFPGNGTTTSLSRFVTESPNPLDFCGWSGSAGLPILALMPEGFTAAPTATLSTTSGPIEVCVLSSRNTTGVAQQILAGNNAVIVIPRAPLASSTYTVSVTTTARTVSWGFTVDPAAATGVQPVPVTQPVGSNVGTRLQPLPPARVVDTRINLGTSRLTGTVQKRIQIAGRGGVPAQATAVSANFTITDPAAAGYLTVWNCGGERPVVSTLNYAAGEAVPNGASVPLDADGGVCVYSLSSADLLVDVNGFYSTSGGGKFSAIEPARLLDTRSGLGGGRLTAGSVRPLRVAGVAGVPADADIVALNVTSVLPTVAGYVTVFPCDAQRPTVSSLNPAPGSIKPNIVLAPVAADGTVCLYTLTDVDLLVDVTGFVADDGNLRFTSASPFRLTDTRDRNRPELHAGTNGQPAAQGQTLTIQVAGTRGIDANAKAVSANVTVIGGVASGYATAFPCGARPQTSTVNYVPIDAIANGAQIPLSANGQLCIYVSQNVHVIVDVNGWWS